jgi:hypothetical protein
MYPHFPGLELLQIARIDCLNPLEESEEYKFIYYKMRL